MQGSRWEYKTIEIDLVGWFNPKIDVERMDGEFKTLGGAGWELVSVIDINRHHGRSSALVAVFKRPT